MAAPPPPPPEGFEGVYPPRTAGAPAVEKPASERIWGFAKSVGTGITNKVKEIDEKHEISKKAGEKAAELNKKAGEKATEVSQSAKESAGSAFSSLRAGAAKKTSEATNAVGRKVGVMTPEERQRWLDGATTVATCAAVFGGSKTRAMAGVTNLAANVGTHVNTAHAAQAAPPGAVGGGSCASASMAPRVMEVQVVASVPSGGVMRINVEGVGAFEVTVPPGVGVGMPFIIEVEEPQSQSVPMGLPVDVSDGRRAMPPQSVPVAQPAGAQPGYAQPGAAGGGALCAGGLCAGVAAAAGAGSLVRELNNLGVSPRDAATMSVQGAKTVQHVSKELGMTPQETLKAGMQGAKAVGQVSKELGVTPAQALNMGLSAAKMFGAAKPAAGGSSR